MVNRGTMFLVASVQVLAVLVLIKQVSCLSSPPPRIRALRQVSSEPLAFTIDDFCDASTCAGLEQNSDEARLRFATLVAGELFAGQWGKHDGLRYNLSTSSDLNNNAGSGQCAEGLHVDTNNGTPFRSVTAILYLNDVPEECGGATVFPLAGAAFNDPRCPASQRLLGDGIYHTRGSAYSAVHNEEKEGTSSSSLTRVQESDAALLESVETMTLNGEGLRIQPQAGRLLLFFSRMDDGEIDPRSWHGGERLTPESMQSASASSSSTTPAAIVEKKIVTLFKEVSYGTTPEHPLSFVGDDTFEKYLSTQVSEQRHFLKALAESHAPFFL